MSRKVIAVLTTSRADWSHLRYPLEAIRAHDQLSLYLIAAAAHCSPEFGQTIDDIRHDGFEPDHVIECLLSSDTDVGMAKTIGLLTLGLSDHLSRLRPDLLLLIADRYEMLAPASVALALRIPVAHIEGGEVSSGAIDEAVRHALTKLAHQHFTPTALSASRLLGLGEEPSRIHVTGAPSLDLLRHTRLLSKPELAAKLGLPEDIAPVVVAYHPTTLDFDTDPEIDALFRLLLALDRPLVFCFPNADAGSRAIIARARALAARRPLVFLQQNLNPKDYWSLLSHADALIGNSSSGIMETGSSGLPTLNIGRRQEGRQRGPQVIDANGTDESLQVALRKVLDPAFKQSLRGMQNPYGDGQASERIAELLAKAPPREQLLNKPPVPPLGAIPRPEIDDSGQVALSAADLTPKETTAVLRVLNRGRLALGPERERFEAEFAAYHEAPHAIATSSGTSALHLALLALGIGQGDEVLTSPFSFIASANAILYVGAEPVFVDIDPETLNLDPNLLEAALTPRTKAILPVHVFGRPAPMPQIQAFAAHHQLIVIEDACEAIGAHVGNKKVGTSGHAGAFGFYPNKAMTTGEGGMLLVQDASVAAEIRARVNQGRVPNHGFADHVHLGFNYRLPELSAALGRAQLARLDEMLEKRAALAARYTEAFASREELLCPAPPAPDTTLAWFVYALRLKSPYGEADRNQLMSSLQTEGIASGRYFAPIPSQPLYQRLMPHKAGHLPHAERAGQTTLALPFSSRHLHTADRVIAATLKALDRLSRP